MNFTDPEQCIDGAIKLGANSRITSGRIEICWNGEWGIVCGTDWDTNDAKVACRQLGLPDQCEGQ